MLCSTKEADYQPNIGAAHLICFDGLVIVLHQVLQGSLPAVALGKVRFQGNALVTVLDAFWVGHQLCQARSTVAVQLVCLWVHRRGSSLQPFTVELDCLCVLLFFESLESDIIMLQAVGTSQQATALTERIPRIMAYLS